MGAHDNPAPPKDNQVPLLEEVPIGDEVLVAPPSMTNGEIRADFLNFAQAMTSQSNSITSQVQAITAQVNLEVGRRVPLHSSNMESHLRDFTRMKPLMIFRSRVDDFD